MSFRCGAGMCECVCFCVMDVCLWPPTLLQTTSGWVGSSLCKMIDWQLRRAFMERWEECLMKMVDFKAVAVVTEGLEVSAQSRGFFGGVGGLLKDSEHVWESLRAPSPTVPLA